jgi:spore coat protein H
MSKRLIFWLCFALAVWVLIGRIAPARHRPRDADRSFVATRHDFGPRVEPRRGPVRDAIPPEASDPLEIAAIAPPPLNALPVEAPDPTVFSGDLFKSVPRIQVFISAAGINALRVSGWGNGQQRPVVKATVREGGLVYTNVAVHLKGSMGSFRPIDDNPGLTLNFSKFALGQTFHGLHKCSLNNSVQDHSFLSEIICRELFDAAGVPAPRAGLATLSLNGRYFGVRVLVEGANKQFLKRYFNDAKGNLYDGGFCQDITGSLAVNSGDNPEVHTGLRALVAALREPDPAKRWDRLNQTLDMDRFISFIAMEILECHWDGYAMNINNWRIFHDLSSNRMVFIPHGMDQMFGIRRANPNYPILPLPMRGWVARVVLSNPEGRRLYLERVSRLYHQVFKVDAILARVDDLAASIRPVIAQTNPQGALYHDESVRRLKERIVQRDQSLRRQLRNLGLAEGN